MKKIIIFFLGLLFFSCGEKVVEKPENLIPKEKMIAILHDLAILKAATTSYRQLMESQGVTTMEFLYDKYQIDSTQFSQSDLYYASMPLEYESIYENVESMLEKRHKELEEAKKRENDSVKKASQLKRDSIKNSRIKKDSIVESN
ncbi:DUF4296 domain-containing protein [Flagellimonas sp. HMM57]|uniref:DUF4296 domain-containing protein n=1 Tax=unclassified Flagellimonas TaxID=2644544 RepID=UPI0013D253A7|nr:MULTISPECIES: DUF4296 domain-containing protein [unclassified Flagellimonas]UII74580.1 DUF4296 domain-containing protein [Flagellimonas sp. HMM57]